MMISIDGMTFNFPFDVERTSTIEESDNSGMMLNGNIKKDVIGTYLSYKITLVIPLGSESRYTTLYELLNSPVPEHTFILPYNQDTITFKGFVSSISDKLFRQENDVTIWRGINFTVEMTEPLKVAE